MVFENKIVCNCKQVSVLDIEKALHQHKSLVDVSQQFDEVQKITNCSTGCGGCHDKVIDIISKFLNGATVI